MSPEILELYQRRLDKIKNLPTLPVIATEIMRITQNDVYSAGQIQTVIEKDPPFAMKLLKVANSSFYGAKHTIKSIRHAVVMIGMKRLSNIAVSFSVLKNFKNSETTIDWEKFWEHSIAVGFVSELLVEQYDIISQESPYTVGLLHDIGKLVLNLLEPEKYIEIYKTVQEQKRQFYEVEKEFLQISHCAAGELLAKKWKISDNIINVIQHHHKVEESDETNYLLSAVVEIADHVCNVKGLSFGTDFDLETMPVPKAWKILQETIVDLENKDYETFLKELDSQIESISEMVEVIQR